MRRIIKQSICCVYKIECLKTGELYIGQTLDFHERKKKHIFSLRSGTHHCKNLQEKWDQYEESEFLFDIVEVAEESELTNLEKKYIDCNRSNLLNSPGGRPPGFSNPNAGRPPTLTAIPDTKIVSLRNPLPCSIRAETPSGICGKDATLAYAYPLVDMFTPGCWRLQPVCKSCAMAAAAVYE